jgi:hypothetical protein
MPRRDGSAEQQSKRRCAGREVRLRREGQIHLEAVAEKKHAIQPRFAAYVGLMHRAVPLIHPGGPFGDRGFELRPFAHTEGQIDVGPAVLAADRR